MQLRALFSLLLTLIHQLTEKGPVSFHALDGRFHTCFFAPLWPSLLVPVSIPGRLLLWKLVAAAVRGVRLEMQIQLPRDGAEALSLARRAGDEPQGLRRRGRAAPTHGAVGSASHFCAWAWGKGWCF